MIVPLIYAFLKNSIPTKKQVILCFLVILFLVFLLRVSLTHIFNTQQVYLNYIRYIYTPLITNIDVFMCGFLVNSWFSCKSNANSNGDKKMYFPLNLSNRSKKILASVLVIALFAFTAYYYYYQKPGQSIFYPALTAIITSLFIGLFESTTHKESFHKNEKLSFGAIRINPIRILEVAGILSYGVYLWHQAILAKITPLITSSNPVEVFWLKLLGTLVLSTVLATVTYYAIELPAARCKLYRISTKTDHSTSCP